MEGDRQGNTVYLTEERWDHIVGHHPEMEGYERELRETVRLGTRHQDPVNPQKYRYARAFPNLAEDNTHVVVIVLFRFCEDEDGIFRANNYVVTAFQKAMG